MDRGPVDEITRWQHSLITTEQFISVTESEAALRWAVEDGWLERYGSWRGLYIVAGAPVTPYQPHMGACLLGGPSAASSKFAGAWLWDCPDIAPCPPDLTFFSSRARRIPGVTVHESRLPGVEWIDRRHGIPTVAASLVVVQLAQAGAGYLAERVANDLFKRHATDHGRSSCASTSSAVASEGARSCAPSASGLSKSAATTTARRLEYAGWADHGTTRDAFDRDALRRSRLTSAGWRILDATSVASHAEVVRWLLATLTGPRLPLS